MSPIYAEFRERLAGIALLPDKPEETPDTTLRALWFTAAGQPRSAVAAAEGDLPALDEAARARLDALVAQRLDHVPLAHLTRRQHFLGLEMIAGPEALVPRRETELLARAVIALAREIAARRADASVLIVDVCTGCGNIPLASAAEVPSVRAFGADLGADAVALARRNAAEFGLSDRVEFRAGDLLAPFDDAMFHARVDILSCNPPYISSGKVAAMPPEIAAHEPRLAFDGGPLGVSILMRLLQDAPRFLAPGGWLAFEVGLGQGPSVARRLKAAGAFGEVRELADEHGDVRAILAQRGDGE